MMTIPAHGARAHAGAAGGRVQHRAGRLAWNQRTHRCCTLLPQAHALARAVRRQDLHRAGAQLDSQHHRQVKTQKSSKPGLQKKIFQLTLL